MQDADLFVIFVGCFFEFNLLPVMLGFQLYVGGRAYVVTLGQKSDFWLDPQKYFLKILL